MVPAGLASVARLDVERQAQLGGALLEDPGDAA
jgi:hypothetical protein